MGDLDLGDAVDDVSLGDDAVGVVNDWGEDTRISSGLGAASGVTRRDETDTSLEVVAFWEVVEVFSEEWHERPSLSEAREGL